MAVSQDTLPKMADLNGSTSRYNNWVNNFVDTMTTLGSTNVAVIAAAGGSANAAALLSVLGSVQDAWTAAYGSLTQPLLRTHSAIINARALRFGPIGDQMPPAITPAGQIIYFRNMIRKIQAAGGIDPGTLGDLGLCAHNNPRSVAPENIPGPELRIIESPPHCLRIRYNQEGKREETKAKPMGCKGVEILWVAENGASGGGTYTKSPILMDLGETMTGHRVTLRGKWMFGNNKASGWGNVVVAGVP